VKVKNSSGKKSSLTFYEFYPQELDQVLTVDISSWKTKTKTSRAGGSTLFVTMRPDLWRK